MDDLEDGELPSSPEGASKSGDEEVAPSYNPLPRPEARPRSATNSSMIAHAGDLETPLSANQSQISFSHQRPTAAQQSNSAQSSDDESSSSSDSDSSDDECPKPKGKKKMLSRPPDRSMEAPPQEQHNPKFAAMARDFQQKRQKKNNVWGSILQEDALNSEMVASLGVGRKSLKELDSDRGAETYDYSLAAEVKAKEEAIATEGEKRDLDRDLDDYFQKSPPPPPRPSADNDDEMGETAERRQDAIAAGVKRSVKDRLGTRRHHEGAHRPDFDHSMSIPPPGMAREIPDLTPEFLQCLRDPENNRRPSKDSKDDHEVEEEEEGCLSDDEESPKSHAMLGEELAAKLQEPKTDLMIGVVDVVGMDVALDLFQKTRELEANGGLMILNNERRRTPGGVYLHLLRQKSSDPNTSEETSKKIKAFFNTSNQHAAHNRSVNKKRRHQLRGGGDFAAELKSFKNFRKTKKKKGKKKQQEAQQQERDCEMDQDDVGAQGGGDLKPLPDILTCITQRIEKDNKPASAASSSSAAGSNKVDNPGSSHGGAGRSGGGKSGGFLGPDVFDEPDAPPNSVEPARSLNHYDDDFLDTAVATEDIELF